MIISCVNCFKKFDINTDLIPKNGRLLECGSCNHKWFFQHNLTKDIGRDAIDKTDNSQNFLFQNEDEKTEELDKNIELNKSKKWASYTPNEKKKVNSKSKKSISVLNIIIVFIISFAALIILIDTFESPISTIIPNIEFLLFNLYESIKDIMLFFEDLI